MGDETIHFRASTPREDIAAGALIYMMGAMMGFLIGLLF